MAGVWYDGRFGDLIGHGCGGAAGQCRFLGIDGDHFWSGRLANCENLQGLELIPKYVLVAESFAVCFAEP